jgi:hypothetical protein
MNRSDFGHGTYLGADEYKEIQQDLGQARQILNLAGLSVPGLSELSMGVGFADAAANNPCVQSNPVGYLVSRGVGFLMSMSGLPIGMLGIHTSFQCRKGRQNIADVLAAMLNKFAGGNADHFMDIMTDMGQDKEMRPYYASSPQSFPNIVLDYKSNEAKERRKLIAYNIIAALSGGFSLPDAVRASIIGKRNPGFGNMNLPYDECLDYIVDHYAEFHDDNGKLLEKFDDAMVDPSSQTPETQNAIQLNRQRYNYYVSFVQGMENYVKGQAGGPGEESLFFLVELFFKHSLKSMLKMTNPKAYSLSSSDFKALSTGNEIFDKPELNQPEVKPASKSKTSTLFAAAFVGSAAFKLIKDRR